jgi:hypothetical protein
VILEYCFNQRGVDTHLINILAKHATPMNASSTVLGRDPARDSIRVIRIRSMFVLESAEEMVKPPISSMIVGENIIEKIKLRNPDQDTNKTAWGHNKAEG